MILLMYLLSLTIIGDILYFVSYSGNFSTAMYTEPFRPLVNKYALWVGFNFALVWIYCLLCVALLKTGEAKHMEEWQSMEEMLSLNWIRDFHAGPTTSSLVWYGVVLVLVGCSVTYDVTHDQDQTLIL